MSTKSAIEIGYRQNELGSSQPSFHLSLPIGERDCAHCVAVAEKGMKEMTALVAALEGRAAREALLNAIGEAVRGMVGTRTTKMIAAGSLGDFLQVDRCFFVGYDAAAGEATIEFDWRRDPLPSIAGTYELDDNAIDAFGLRDLRTHVVSELSSEQGTVQHHWNPQFTPGAYVHVPLVDAGIPVGALVVAMESRSRDWSADEICVIENVAAIARSAIDTDHLRTRERTLRTSFRSALVPEVPASIPGIDLSVVYRPCDVEAGVGGDFYDVFDVGGGRTALILGDVSGRGLAAAPQVATLRNMLRYALYQQRPLAEAVAEVNRIAIENRLLADYATVFVSIYDRDERTLTYVCCGHEPPLLRNRSTDRVTVLVPTGPVLGIASEESFGEEVEHIERGDCLLIYSDGLSDIGSARCQLYSVARLIQILRHGRPPFAAATLVDAVMSGIVDYGVRGCNSAVDDRQKHFVCDFADDVCVLAAVFTG